MNEVNETKHNADTRQCVNCLTVFTPKTARSKYCSDKCKTAFNRNNKSIVTNVTETKKAVTERVTEKLTKTDQLFQDDAIARKLGDNWLAFSEVIRNPKCNHCQKNFKTQLPMLRYCSPDCRAEEMSGLVSSA